MAARVIRPSKIAPEIPVDVALFLQSELDRHQLALEGDTTDSDSVLADMEEELDALDDEEFFNEDDSWRIARLTSTSYMILRGLQDQLRTLDHPVPNDQERRHRAANNFAYAKLLRSGVEVASWKHTWDESPYGSVEWPTEEHVICSSVANQVEAKLGSQEKVLQLANLLHPVVVGDVAA